MTDERPLVSVVMPAYNAAAFIGEAVSSVLNQSFQDFELVIINDGSVDSTSVVVRSFSDRRIIVLDNKKNEGIASAVNLGLSIAQGRYIARLDADDIAFRERLAVQFHFMENNPEVIVCGSDMQFLGKQLR